MINDIDAIRHMPSIVAQIQRMRGSFTPDAVARELGVKGVKVGQHAVLEVLHLMWNKAEVLRTSPEYWRVIDRIAR
jgi:hypothetical protein